MPATPAAGVTGNGSTRNVVQRPGTSWIVLGAGPGHESPGCRLVAHEETHNSPLF